MPSLTRTPTSKYLLKKDTLVACVDPLCSFGAQQVTAVMPPGMTPVKEGSMSIYCQRDLYLDQDEVFEWDEYRSVFQLDADYWSICKYVLVMNRALNILV